VSSTTIESSTTTTPRDNLDVNYVDVDPNVEVDVNHNACDHGRRVENL
jgi:hypothetical protein